MSNVKIPDILHYLFEEKILNQQEAKYLMINIANNKFTPAQISALVSIYNMRTPKLEEIKGFYEALLDFHLHLNFNPVDAIDLSGTGGDGKNTFNISTLAAFIVAGSGGKVIKHSNYSASSITGSSNLLESLGYKFTNEEGRLQKELEKSGICFLHAPLFHPVMKNVYWVRREIGIMTFFNILGPLLNPSEPHYQLLGVNNLEIARLYYYFFKNEKKNYAIIHSLDGYDEISLTSPFKCYDSKGESIYTPQELGRLKLLPKTITGGKNPEENKRIFVRILSGEGSKSQNEVVLTNAAFSLCLLNNKDFKSNYMIAKESLESKKAKKVLETLLNI
ncbi:MAG: anthranilate phosphoribosyltransferase [Candidatus Walczuchella monophlebidarum]